MFAIRVFDNYYWIYGLVPGIFDLCNNYSSKKKIVFIKDNQMLTLNGCKILMLNYKVSNFDSFRNYLVFFLWYICLGMAIKQSYSTFLKYSFHFKDLHFYNYTKTQSLYRKSTCFAIYTVRFAIKIALWKEAYESKPNIYLYMFHFIIVWFYWPVNYEYIIGLI
jgi:hypothetical protein